MVCAGVLNDSSVGENVGEVEWKSVVGGEVVVVRHMDPVNAARTSAVFGCSRLLPARVPTGVAGHAGNVATDAGLA